MDKTAKVGEGTIINPTTRLGASQTYVGPVRTEGELRDIARIGNATVEMQVRAILNDMHGGMSFREAANNTSQTTAQAMGGRLEFGKAPDSSVHAIPISDALRGTVQQGQPLYARGEKKERPAARALSAVSRSPGEYKHLLSWTKTNHGDLYDPALSDHENATRVLAGLADSAERPEGLSGVAGMAFQRFRTALGKGATEESLQGKPEADMATPTEQPKAPEVDGSTWRDVRRNEDTAYKSEREFLDDYRDNGFRETRETAEEFLKRRFCAGRI